MARDKTPGIISSVPIAAATAAYARMRLNEFVNLSDNPCFYTDTDSVILQNPLPENMVGRGLGQMKLEHIIRQGIIIAPKTYALKTQDGNLITRAKGLSIKMTWENYQALLHGETLTFNQTKFFRNMSQGTILICPTIFTQKGINIQPIGDVGLVPYVRPDIGIVVYKEPILALVVVNPSWEVATKVEDEGIKISFVVFDPKKVNHNTVYKGPGLAPFVAKTKPKSKPKKTKPPVKKSSPKGGKGKKP